MSKLKLPPNSAKIGPVPFNNQTAALVNRVGGTEPLPVIETQPGVFVSAWVVNRPAMEILKRRGAVLSIVVDTNVPGHPSLSIMAQMATLTKD